MSSTTPAPELPSRAALRNARRVCVKAGTSVVANENGMPSLTRLGAIAEQIAELVAEGVEVIFVSSGAVGMGKRVLRNQKKNKSSRTNATPSLLLETDDAPRPAIRRDSHGSFANLLHLHERPHTYADRKGHYDSACAAAGQFEMMNLYQSLFSQVDVAASQILVTQADFSDATRSENLKYAVDRLLSLGMVPILNENDAVSNNQGYTKNDDVVFSDNDSLAALCARTFDAQVLILLTDVNGVYDSSPKENQNAKLLPFYRNDIVEIGSKSVQGRGGMRSKLDAAMGAVAPGSRCSACVVAAGHDLNSIRALLGRATTASTSEAAKGTLFVTPNSDLEKQAIQDYQPQQLAEEEEDTVSVQTVLLQVTSWCCRRVVSYVCIVDRCVCFCDLQQLLALFEDDDDVEYTFCCDMIS